MKKLFTKMCAPIAMCGSQHLSIVWFCLGLAPLASQAAVTFGIGDGTFAPANWSQHFSSSAPGTTFGYSQIDTGGNPGSFGQINLTILGSGNSYLMTYFTGQSYSPLTQAPILSIDFAADFKAVTYGDIFFGFKQGTAYYFLLPPPFTHIDNTSWSHVSYTANTESMFGDILSYARPNFTSGAPLQFGVFMSYTTAGAASWPFSIAMDNFQVTVTAVPEPATVPLALLALGLLAAVRRHWRLSVVGRKYSTVPPPAASKVAL